MIEGRVKLIWSSQKSCKGDYLAHCLDRTGSAFPEDLDRGSTVIWRLFFKILIPWKSKHTHFLINGNHHASLPLHRQCLRPPRQPSVSQNSPTMARTFIISGFWNLILAWQLGTTEILNYPGNLCHCSWSSASSTEGILVGTNPRTIY